MKWSILIFLFLLVSCNKKTNPEEETPTNPDPEAYFPPLQSNAWETNSADELGWNTAELIALKEFLVEKNTKAFIILKEGKIVSEDYFGNTTQSKKLPWNSAGKTLTSTMVGIAQDEGKLNIMDASSDYLGVGWTSMTAQEEEKIKIVHQLSMATGLNYLTLNFFCTDADCLKRKDDPNKFWYYYNPPYTLLTNVVASAAEKPYKEYFQEKLQGKIGMDGNWIKIGFNEIFYSNARSMARFGLLMLRKGKWEEERVVSEEYFQEMTTTSQSLNLSYGYLWWLNGKSSYHSPGSVEEFSGKLIATAPDDLFAGLGKNDQKLYVVPSQDLVIIRMGDSAEESLLGPSSFDTQLWQRLSSLMNL